MGGWTMYFDIYKEEEVHRCGEKEENSYGFLTPAYADRMRYE